MYSYIWLFLFYNIKKEIQTIGVKYTLPKEVQKTIKFLGGSNWILKQVYKYLDNK